MRFSVIVPVYNSAPFLMQCVESVAKQTFPDWELILVDDGSTDGSNELIRQLAEQEPRIRPFYQENRGQFFARRTGIENAGGEYLLFLDSDDAFSSDCLEKIDRALRKYSADMVLFTGKVIENGREAGRSIGYVFSQEKEIPVDWIKERLITSHDINSLCLKAIRRELFSGDCSDYSAFSGVCCGEDKVQLFYPVSNARSAAYLPEPLYIYQRRSDSVTRTFSMDMITCMIADNMYATLHQYMEMWGLDKGKNRELAEVLYLKNILSVYFGLRGRHTTVDERRRLHQYPWRKAINKAALRYRFSCDLSLKDKVKLLVIALFA